MGFIARVIYVSLSRRCDVISMQIAFVSVLRNGRPKGCETLLDDVRKHVREADFLHCALLDFFLSFTLFFFFFCSFEILSNISERSKQLRVSQIKSMDFFHSSNLVGEASLSAVLNIPSPSLISFPLSSLIIRSIQLNRFLNSSKSNLSSRLSSFSEIHFFF